LINGEGDGSDKEAGFGDSSNSDIRLCFAPPKIDSRASSFIIWELYYRIER